MCLYATAQAQCVSSSCVIFYMHNVTEVPHRAALAQRDRKQDSGPAVSCSRTGENDVFMQSKCLKAAVTVIRKNKCAVLQQEMRSLWGWWIISIHTCCWSCDAMCIPDGFHGHADDAGA